MVSLSIYAQDNKQDNKGECTKAKTEQAGKACCTDKKDKACCEKRIKLVPKSVKRKAKLAVPTKIKAQNLPPAAILQKQNPAGKKVDSNFSAITQFSEFAVNTISLKSGLSKRDIPIKQITYFLNV